MARSSIGLDIGWSMGRRTCALATIDCHHDWGLIETYQTGGVQVGLFTLTELLAYLPRFAALNRGKVRDIVVVLDGPIGPNGPPRQNRLVDTRCINNMRGRAQPSQVAHGQGLEYVQHTYTVIECLQAVSQLCGTEAVVWMGTGDIPEGKLVIAETNPTVALALMLPQQGIATLPTRHRARRINRNGTLYRSIRAKSDWYWELGAKSIVADQLACDAIRDETNHERIAGLTCLALASQLARRESLAIGDNDGIYVIHNTVDTTWLGVVELLGVVSGIPQYIQGHAEIEVPPQPILVAEEVAENQADYDVKLAGDGGEFVLFLNDNGGVWERHNEWLAGMLDEGIIMAIDNGQSITLTRAGRAGQWTSCPTPLDLARARHVNEQHLSGDTPCEIPVRVEGQQLPKGIEPLWLNNASSPLEETKVSETRNKGVRNRLLTLG